MFMKFLVFLGGLLGLGRVVGKCRRLEIYGREDFSEQYPLKQDYDENNSLRIILVIILRGFALSKFPGKKILSDDGKRSDPGVTCEQPSKQIRMQRKHALARRLLQ